MYNYLHTGQKSPQYLDVPGFPAEWVKEMTVLHLWLSKERMGLGFLLNTWWRVNNICIYFYQTLLILSISFFLCMYKFCHLYQADRFGSLWLVQDGEGCPLDAHIRENRH